MAACVSATIFSASSPLSKGGLRGSVQNCAGATRPSVDSSGVRSSRFWRSVWPSAGFMYCVWPIISAMVRMPIEAMISRTSRATKRK